MSYLGNTPITQSFIAGTDTFSGTGSQTAFTLSRSVNSVNDILVVVNNVDQQPTAYTVSGTTLTMSAAPSAGTNNVYVRYLSTTLQSITVPGGSTVVGNFGLTGDLQFAGTAQRITGDFSNATLVSRAMFQTSTVNGNTIVSTIPNGTSTQSQYEVFNNSTPTNASRGQLIVNATEVSVRSTIAGTGTYLPMTFYTNGSERARIATNGDFSFNSGYGSAAVAYGCRAWVNFNGTGTIAIRASGNVTSITDNGVGTYAVNFTTAMPDANYCVQAASLYLTATNSLNIVSSITTSVANITHAENNLVADSASMYVAIFR